MNYNRINQIDSIRGLSCLLMFIYHLEVGRVFMNNYQPLFLGTWFDSFLGNYIRISFLLLVGVGFYLFKDKGNLSSGLNRLFNLFLVSALITISSYVFLIEYTIYLGIIHFIFLVSVYFNVLIRSKYQTGLIYFSLLVLLGLSMYKYLGFNSGVYVIDYVFGFPGISFKTMDYFPILPWGFIPIFGYLIAHSFVKNVSKIKIALLDNKYLVLVGKNALLFYVVHVVFIVGFLYLLNYLL